MKSPKDLPDTLRAEYDAGATLRELAARHGSNMTAVRIILQADGLPLRSRGSRAMPGRTAAILAELAAGHARPAVAAAFGVTRQHVQQIAAAHGRTPRRQQAKAFRSVVHGAQGEPATAPEEARMKHAAARNC
jgi:hypothetical protein